MGRSTLLVRFPDGTVRWGVYQNTSDVVSLDGRLFDAQVRGKGNVDDTEAEDGEAVPVDVWCLYGGGFGWAGQATPSRLLPPHSILDVAGYVDGPAPRWVVDATERNLRDTLSRRASPAGE